MQLLHLKPSRAFALCLLIPGGLFAQNPSRFLENDQVIVNAPHPGIDVPGFPKKMHDHPLNRVMVYLHPGGETLTYKDGHVTVLKWAQGEAQWSPASGLHMSQIPPENPSFDTPMIVDIGIKKPGTSDKPLGGPLDVLHVDASHYKVEIENKQVRVLRLKMAPKAMSPMHEHALNRLVVYITDANLREVSPSGEAQIRTHKTGEFAWATPTKHTTENLSDKPFEAVVVEFKN